jgi:preprotein translocase subunit YajC
MVDSTKQAFMNEYARCVFLDASNHCDFLPQGCHQNPRLTIAALRACPVAAGFPQEDFFVLISEAFAQTAPAPVPSGMDAAFGGLGGMLPLILVTVVMYFLMIRPQLKRQKDAKALVEALAVSDEVVTTGGLVGKITKVDATYLHLEVSSGVVLQVQRQAVVQVLPKGTLSK